MTRFSGDSRLAVAGLMLSAGMYPLSLSANSPMMAQPSDLEREGMIFERQQIMQQLERDAEVLGNIAAGIEPASKLAATTASIAQAARDSAASFAKPIPGGRAKPEVWSNKADFDTRMSAFVRSAERMAVAGRSGSVAQVSEMMIEALPCKQCHDAYRAPKKP